MVRIAQISDLHVRRSSDRAAREADRALIRCLAAVNAAQPDVVIVTGDLTERGHEDEYRQLRKLMCSLAIPYYLLPGNHDHAGTLRSAFGDREYLFQAPDHVSYAFDAGSLRVIALDSTKHGRPGGYLDAPRMRWLESQLAADAERPVLLALHHPPFTAGVWPLDWLGFANVGELAAIVRAHRRIVRIISGHVHCARAATWSGTFACTSPSPRDQRLLIGVGWRPPVLHLEGAGFLLHSFSADGEVRTAVHRLNGRVESLTV